jgi:hypothetical protein
MSEVSAEELLEVYMSYPRRIGRTKGLEVLKRTVRTRKDLELCKKALAHFAAAHRGQEMRFIRHFDRWARTWRDWLDVEESPRESARVLGRNEWETLALALEGRKKG